MASGSSFHTTETEIILQEVARVLRHATPPKQNITQEEIKSLRALRENTDIIILPADKGNAAVHTRLPFKDGMPTCGQHLHRNGTRPHNLSLIHI